MSSAAFTFVYCVILVHICLVLYIVTWYVHRLFVYLKKILSKRLQRYIYICIVEWYIFKHRTIRIIEINI